MQKIEGSILAVLPTYGQAESLNHTSVWWFITLKILKCSQSLQTSFYPQDQNEVNCLGTEGSNDLYGLQKTMEQMLWRQFL